MSEKEFDKRLNATIKLSFPVEVNGTLYEELSMRRPKTKDTLLAAKQKGGEVERGVYLMARLCDVEPDVIEELDEVDAEKLGEQHKAFTGRERE